MFLTPNKIKWGTCPGCKIELNTWEGIPAEAVGDWQYHEMKCLNESCSKNLLVRVRVEFTVELEEDG